MFTAFEHNKKAKMQSRHNFWQKSKANNLTPKVEYHFKLNVFLIFYNVYYLNA